MDAMPAQSFSERVHVVAKSMGVGALATVSDLAVLSALVTFGHWSPRLASPVGLAVGIAIQFFGNKLFAFEDRSPRWVRQGAQFLMIEMLGFGLNLWLFDVAVRALPLPLLVVRLLTTNAVYFGVCLPLWSRVFRRSAAIREEG